MQALERGKSDHTPLILSMAVSSPQGKQHSFKFELGWLIRDGFREMVTQIWQQETTRDTTIEKWLNKIRAL